MPVFGYQRQVSPSGEAPVVSGDVGAGSGLSALGGAVTDIAIDYQNRKNVERHKSDIADYQLALRDFQTNLESEKTQALMDGKATYKDLNEKVVQPAMSKFKADMQGKDYIRTARPEIDTRLGMDFADINAKTMEETEALELEDYTNKQAQVGQMAMADGDYETADEIFNGLAGIVGEAEANNLKSKSTYHIFDIEGAETTEAFKSGAIGPEQYISDMKSIRDEIEQNKSLNPDHRATLTSRLTYQIANASSAAAKKADDMERNLRKQVINGDVDDTWKDIAVVTYGERAVPMMEKILSSSLRDVSGTDEYVREGLTLINKMKTSPETYVDVLEYASNDEEGKYGEELRELASIVAGEGIDSNASISYEKYVPGGMGSLMMSGAALEKEKRQIPYTGWVADMHDDINKAAETEDDLDVIRGYQRDLINFYDKNPNPTKEEKQEFRENTFGEHWMKQAESFSAPQDRSGDRTISRTGKTADGKKVIQYSDGTIEYAD